MGDVNETSTPPDNLSKTLIEQIDTLELSDLRALQSYIDQRIESLRTPFESEIETNAAGEVLAIEDHGGYALVRKHPPDPNGEGVNTEITSLYHVRREPHPDGTESLHWAYLGNVQDTAETRCSACGQPVDPNGSTCPFCGQDIDRPDTEL